MDSQTNSYPTPPSSSASRLCGWWSRPIATLPAATNGRQATLKEYAASLSPFLGAIFTIVAIFLILHLYIDQAQPHAKVSIQNIAVSSDTWQIDFLVKNPSFMYLIYSDDGDGDATVGLGHLNAAVLNITRKRDSKDHAAFSLVFVAEQGNRSDAVYGEQLDITLRARHKRYTDFDEAGHLNIRCQNLIRGREKIICQSSFTPLKTFEEGLNV
ncbi:unnamed protein product [Thlaspi arvense]|uniref:Late embryogenesis abundant protein LEA-2 subgroup domain-containing protein n=1 Tax=Thlaspi arvense TaxID=13288 RepID=A0AAU9SXY2_THLAR|nr:unnamed protein product [Thlaspi arvense]